MLLLVILASIILGIIYIWIIPPWQSPDEPTHFEYVKAMAEGDPPWSPRPRVELQAEIIASLDRHDYWRYVQVDKPPVLPRSFREAPFLHYAPSQIGKNPPIYYWLGSRLLQILPRSTIENELYWLRVLSLLFSVLTVYFVWAAAREIFGNQSPIGAVSAGLAAFIPQFLVIGTSVSPDPPVNFFGAVAIFLVLKFQRTGFTGRRILLLLLWHGIGLLVNYKFLILLAALPVVILVNMCRPGTGPIPYKKLIFWSASFTVIILFSYAGLIWYFPMLGRIFVVRSSILYSTISSFLRGGTYFPDGYWNWFHSELFRSFWLKYGWMKFELAPFYYGVLKIACLTALAGLAIFWGRQLFSRKPAIDRTVWKGVLTLMIYALFSLGSYYLFWGIRGIDTTAQGRHLFLVMPAWAILFTLGWSSLFPSRRQRLVGYCLLAAFFLLATSSILFFILPTFS